MAKTKMMAIKMERNGQNKDIFWSPNYEDLLMDMGHEGKEKN